MSAAYCKRDWSSHPAPGHAAYASTALRAPREPLVPIAHSLSEITGPGPIASETGPPTVDLSRGPRGAAIGERIIVTGRVLDGDGRPLPRALVEIWQANAAGRYRHEADQHDAPLDPDFSGTGHVLTDDAGAYRFVTIRPGAYPWGNHANAWRPSHIHFSLFGPSLATRLVTQMYFPGDPLLALDPILNAIADADARSRLVANYAHDVTEADRALGFHFDIVLRGRADTPMDPTHAA